MSTALALAGVTAVLRDVIDAWLIEQNANAALNGQNAEVTAVAPDTIETSGANVAPRLNLYLHQASQNASWRNVDLPSRDERGARRSSPPLALDLHYLLTAYGPQELQAEVLLGFGMQVLHEIPLLSREEIESRLPPQLRPSRLGSQIELVKIVPAAMSVDEISKLWTAIQSHYRPTAAYTASVVLIESPSVARAPLPVLTRGKLDLATNREAGVDVRPSLIPPVPAITAVRPPANQSTAVLGDTVELEGHDLGGTLRAVLLECPRMKFSREIQALAGSEEGVMRFEIPDEPAAVPVGEYTVCALLLRPGELERRATTPLPLRIVPVIDTALPMNLPRDAQGDVSVTLSFRPDVMPGQQVSLLLGTREVAPTALATPTGSLTFTVTRAAVGPQLVRLRIDGLDSRVVDATAMPPRFFNRRIVIS